MIPKQAITDRFKRGDIINVAITKIIPPSQIVTSFDEFFIGRLSLLEIAWCLPEAEEVFNRYKEGDDIQCVIVNIDVETKQVLLSRKYLHPPLSDKIGWERIERGDTYDANIIAVLHDYYLIQTNKGFFGIIRKIYLTDVGERLKVKVNSKIDLAELLEFVPASLDTGHEHKQRPPLAEQFSAIEYDLQSFINFKQSMLGRNASDEVLEIIRNGFLADDGIFSKQLSTGSTIYFEFEHNTPSYDISFKEKAISGKFIGQPYSLENERTLLQQLSEEAYWFRINKKGDKRSRVLGLDDDIVRRGDELEYQLFNENIQFYGYVSIDASEEPRFKIRSFSIGNTFNMASEAKKRNARQGAFLFSDQLQILSPWDSLPMDISQRPFLELTLHKKRCFELVSQLRIKAGEILIQEGRTLGIIDKFLEYQIDIINEQKGESVYITPDFERLPGVEGAVTLKLPKTVADTIEEDEDTIVYIRLKDGDTLVKAGQGLLVPFQDTYKLNFNSDIRLDELRKKGFYIDKKISKRQLYLQREIIQEFLTKRIRIDHIESLLVNPDGVKPPVLSEVKFFNPHLEQASRELSDNNQVRAVRKAIGNKNIFLIQGPPGTGKTTVIAEVISQLVRKGQKILVAGQNHVAVDNVLEKIAQNPELGVLRVGNPEKVNKELVKYTIDNLIESYKQDYNNFLGNQVALAKIMVEHKVDGIPDDVITGVIMQQATVMSTGYGYLKNVFLARHKQLYEGLRDLKNTEMYSAVKVFEDWHLANAMDHHMLLRPLIYGAADVVFATCIGIKTDAVFRSSSFKFDTVIIDEAGKANIAESLVAVELGDKVILVGDQMQLPPYIDGSMIDEREEKSFPKSKFGKGVTREEIVDALKSSFFEFIIRRINSGQFPADNMEMLNYQHRMHPNIGRFVSESFYNSRVQMGEKTSENRMVLPVPFDREVVFFDTSNAKNPYEQFEGLSYKNDTEAAAIANIILPKLIDDHHVPAKDIAIIAPYKSQVANIKRYVKNVTTHSLQSVEVSTLDSFQGKEYDLIIFSFTRSADHRKSIVENDRRKFTKVGFLDDARRLNVAFSRARKKLILIGNAKSLTDRRSHYDIGFDYTGFYQRLVTLSKNESIGRFVNLAEQIPRPQRENDVNIVFKRFASQHWKGQKIEGKFKRVSIREGNILGLVVMVDQLECFLHFSYLNGKLKNRIQDLAEGYEFDVVIHSMDEERSKVFLRLPQKTKREKLDWWHEKIQYVTVDDVLYGEVLEIFRLGYLIQMENGLKGLLPWRHLKKHQRLKEGQRLSVRIQEIEHNTKKIFLSFNE